MRHVFARIGVQDRPFQRLYGQKVNHREIGLLQLKFDLGGYLADEANGADQPILVEFDSLRPSRARPM